MNVQLEARALYVFFAIQLFYPMIIAIILISTTGISGYGDFVPLLVMCAIASVLVDFGSNLFAPLRLGGFSSRPSLDRKIASLALFRLILGSAVGAFALVSIDTLVPNLDPAYSGCMVIVAISSIVLSSQTVAYARREMYGFVKIVAPVRLLALIFASALALQKVGGAEIVAVHLTSGLLISTLAAPRLPLKVSVNRRLLKALRIEVSRIIWHGLAYIVGNLGLQIPYLIAGLHLNAKEVGALHLGGTVVRAVSSLPEPLTLAIHAQLHRLRNDKENYGSDLRAAFERSQLLASGFGTLTVLALAILAYWAAQGGYDGAGAVDVVLLAQCGIPLFVTVSNIMLYRYVAGHEYERVHLYIIASGILLLVTFSLIGVRVAGVAGLAGAVGLHELVVAIVLIALCRLSDGRVVKICRK